MISFIKNIKYNISLIILFTYLIFLTSNFVQTEYVNRVLLLSSSAVIIYLIYDYIKRKIYYNKLNGMLNNEKLNYFYNEAEVLHNKYINIDSEIFHSILNSSYKKMNDSLKKSEANNLEYKEYVESWVHEIKLPISTIKLMIQSKNINNNILVEEINKIDDYVEQSLYYAKLNELHNDYIIKEQNLEKIVNETLRENKNILIKNNFNIKLENLDVVVLSDERWLKFILKQLLQNAIKYRSSTSEIRITSISSNNNVILSVEDNGTGIKEDEIKNVFNKGFVGTLGRKDKKSTGIGLYMCSKLCEKLGHNIFIESLENEYTKVSLVFSKSEFYI